MSHSAQHWRTLAWAWHSAGPTCCKWPRPSSAAPQYAHRLQSGLSVLARRESQIIDISCIGVHLSNEGWLECPSVVRVQDGSQTTVEKVIVKALLNAPDQAVQLLLEAEQRGEVR